MEKWIAEPLNGVNGVLFGMSRKDVREALKLPCKEFKKSKFSKNTTDDFGICHVFYDEDNRCQAIEVFDDAEITVNGKCIFPTDVEEVRSVFQFEENEGCFINRELSIGIYAPNGQIESILFAVKGYYR